MTLIGKLNGVVGSGESYLYYLLNPKLGANNLVVTTSSGTMLAANASYSGAQQNGVPDSSATLGASGNASQSSTSVADNCWFVAAGSNQTASVGAGTGVTSRATNSNEVLIGDSNGVKTPPGSYTMQITGTGNTGIIMASFAPRTAPPSPLYWVGGTGSWDGTATHWSLTSGGAGGTDVPDATTNVIFDGNSGGGTVTISASAVCNSLNFTGFTGTLAGSSPLAISGSLTLVSGLTLVYTGTITFNSANLGNTITTAGKVLISDLVFNGVGGGWTLQDNMVAKTVTLSAGVLNLSSMTLSLSSSGTPWNASGGSIIGGTSTIKLTDATSSAKLFAGGGMTYNNLWVTGTGTGAYTISGSNTFSDFKADTPPHTINFTAGTTQYLQTFTVNGTPGNLMTLQSTSSGNPWFLKKISSGTVVCDYLSLKDSHAS